jgi:hypothetical protein
MSHLDPFDPDNLRLAGATVPVRSSRTPPRHRPGQWFLRGPIPWPWLECAALLPGKSLALSLCLWREANRRRLRTVRLCLSRAGLGLSEYATRRALRALQTAELVSVVRKPGRGLEVTLLDAPESKGATGNRQTPKPDGAPDAPALPPA